MADQGWTLKRLAWAYGCAKKGSEGEAAALRRLLDRVREIDAEGVTEGEIE